MLFAAQSFFRWQGAPIDSSVLAAAPTALLFGWFLFFFGADRVGLVHIKDADLTVADRLNAGELTLMEAVQSGMFPPVGRGDLDIDSVIASLEASGYTGWYVLEQDAAITDEVPAVGKGPIEDVLTSVEYLRGLESRIAA